MGTKSARDIAQTNKGRADTREIWQFIKAISSEGQRAAKRPKRGAAARASMHWAPNNRNRELSQAKQESLKEFAGEQLENILQVLRLQIPMRYGNWLTAAQQPPTDLRDWAIAVLAVQRDMKQLTVQTEGAMQLLVGKQQEAQALMQTMNDELTEVQQGLTQTEEEICRGQEAG